jgi:hypothetical protein
LAASRLKRWWLIRGLRVFKFVSVVFVSSSLKGTFIMRQISKIGSVLAAAVIASSAASVFAAGEHSHEPKRGGVVIETKVGDIEIVAKPDSVQIYISDHGKPMKIEGAKARVTLLNGTEKTEADLTVAGDRLEAKGNFKVTKGTKGIALVTLNGKSPVTGRFEIK